MPPEKLPQQRSHPPLAAEPCVPLAAERGAAMWTARLEWGLVSGDFIVKAYGSAGRLGRPAELTVRRAGAAHCCVSCGHDIPRGVLYGASMAGLIHYCGCCVTPDRPEDQFISGRRAA